MPENKCLNIVANVNNVPFKSIILDFCALQPHRLAGRLLSGALVTPTCAPDPASWRLAMPPVPARKPTPEEVRPTAHPCCSPRHVRPDTEGSRLRMIVVLPSPPRLTLPMQRSGLAAVRLSETCLLAMRIRTWYWMKAKRHAAYEHGYEPDTLRGTYMGDRIRG
jgi:hypothetical protein